MKDYQAILFDLDGTLLDTAPDFLYALNELRIREDLPLLPLSAIRPIANLGSKAMIKHALEIDELDPKFELLRKEFLSLYDNNIAHLTQFFPEIEQLLDYLEQQRIPWGIVTNKLTRHTAKLLKAFNLSQRLACVVCGDTLTTYKPDPGPLLYACEQLKIIPQHCLYVGDAVTDVQASKAAGITALVALYGYIPQGENPYTWQADGYVQEASHIINWLGEGK